MIKETLTTLFLLVCLNLQAQLTIVVDQVPANTPPGADVYVAGNFNNWNAGSPDYRLATNPDGSRSITFSPAPGTLEFKFTRGSWPTVEGNANGQYLPNRTYPYNGQAQTVHLNILSWEDQGVGGGGTAAPNVYVLDDDFYIPQLNRTRRILVYLPPDYGSTNKKYPVLYMHDGQNLFDASTSFSGEWEVDESLNALHQQGDYGCIVVGIYNGGALRLDEYSPWINPQYGGGEGEAYMDFIVETLKPHIDSLYRTLPGRLTTGIMGSSMGGLISMYGFTEHQDVFSRAGVFSPAFWFAGSESADHVTSTGKQGDARVYFLAGGQEPGSVAQNMYAVKDAMLGAGFQQEETKDLVPADGQHSEWFWRREFPAAYQWLFANTVGTDGVPASDFLDIYPNPVADQLRIQGLEGRKAVPVQLFNAQGRMLRDTTIQPGASLNVSDLPPGLYLVKARVKPGQWKTGKVVVE